MAALAGPAPEPANSPHFSRALARTPMDDRAGGTATRRRERESGGGAEVTASRSRPSRRTKWPTTGRRAAAG